MTCRATASPAPRGRGASHSRRLGQRGFSLVEVLITAAIVVVAFTGLTTLQALSVRSAMSSLQRSQATQLAYDVLDRLRVNRQAALDGDYNATLCKGASPHAGEGWTCEHNSTTSLNPVGTTDFVTRDLRDWWLAIDSAGLTNWYAAIDVADDQALVTVQWDDTRAEDVSPSASSDVDSCIGRAMVSSMQEVCLETQL